MLIFTGGALIQGILCLTQFSGLIDTQNKYFKVTGSLYNPNITAMYITVCLPFVLFLLNNPKFKAHSIIALIIFITGLLLLGCRTA
jgi:hypothetical protein